jgi:hypothetical protein
MALVNLLRGDFTGKLGGMVGAPWKNKSTVRTYKKPHNPKTEEQMRVRGGFGEVTKFLALFTGQLKGLTALDVRGESERNALLHLNREEIAAGALDPAKLIISKGGLPALTITGATGAADKVSITFTAPQASIITRKAKIVGVWVNKAKTLAAVGSGPLATNTLTINNAVGAAPGDFVYAYILDYRGSSKVASRSEYFVTT